MKFSNLFLLINECIKITVIGVVGKSVDNLILVLVVNLLLRYIYSADKSVMQGAESGPA